MKQQSSSIVTLALILAAGGINLKAIAQTAADNFPLPTSVSAGTKVQIDGSSSLQAVNQGLKDRFHKQFPNADVTVPTQYQGSDSGVKAIVQDKADLAGIGRALTAAEKAEGLTAKSIGRSKIAIIVKDSNPYKGNLTLKDFAKIYRGEVTDWSQLPSANGAKGKIKVIDRPDTSDTRRAFANYPVFQNGKLKTGSNAQKLSEDSTQSVVDKLGEDGIGYAPADQVKNIPGVRSVTLHGTQPDNPKYPFSQPLAYAYKNKGGKVSEGAKAFLGYVGDASGKQVIQESIASGTTAAGAGTSPTATESPNPTDTASTTTTTGTTATTGTNGTATGGTTGTATTSTTTTKEKGGLPWWPLLILPIGALLWLLSRKKPEATPPVTPVPDTTTGIKPLYPPPPSRTARGDGLSGDLSGDLSSNLGGGYRPSGDLRSGDLRSGDLSGTMPPPTATNAPNINFNGVVDPIKNPANDINLAGGAAIAGGAAALGALGKGIYDSTKETVGDRARDLQIPEVKTPEIDLSNPLEGLKDKSSNLIPNLDLNNPLEGIKDKAGDFIQGGGAAVAAGGAAIAGGASNLFNRDNPASSDLNLELPDVNFSSTAEGIQAKASDLIPDVNLNPTGDGGLFDRVGDFLKDGGGAAAAGGAAAVAGGAALAGGAGQSVSNFFGGQKDLDLSEDLALEVGTDNDPFNFGTPLESVKDKATDVVADLQNDPFDLSSPLDSLKDKAGDFLTGGGAAVGAAGAAAVAGGAALFGGGKKAEISELNLNSEDTFDRDLEAINLDDLDEDPFAGLSDLLGEETGDMEKDTITQESSGFLDGFKDKAAGLLDDGKNLGGAALAGGAAATVGAGQAFQSFFGGKETPTEDRGEMSGNLYSEGQITLVSPSPTQAYAHWEIPVRLKRQLREQGGQKLVVRLYDVTNFDSNIELPTTFQEFECSDSAWDLEIPIGQSEHRYLTEIGYVTGDGRWLMLARSAPLWIRAQQS
jgi:ABC-type phosphate transport system substrate-binding protein